jgi:hypothetical protein
LVVDVGHAYVVQGTLQNSANAAALAAAGYVYTSKNASVNTSTMADQYSAMSGDENAYTGSTVNTYPSTKCLNMLMPKGASCTTGSAPNAVQVIQATAVKTTFMGLLGMKTLNVSATATASMQGSSLPWNIAVIIDSTGSMATTDSNCNGETQFQCALDGVQSLLHDVNPCPGTETSCTPSATAGGANVRVSLFTFPNVLTAVNGSIPVIAGTHSDSIKDEIACGGTPATWTNYAAQPIAAPYTLPVPGATLPVYTSGNAPSTYDVGLNYLRYTTGGASPTTWDATYQITPFLSDYYDATQTATHLNTSSNLVKAIGYGSTLGCLTYTYGIWGVGSGSGFGNTYTASAIYSAQSALTAEAATYGGQNALILLSDGGMNASLYAGEGSTPTNQSAYGAANSSNQYTKANEFPQAPANSAVGPTYSSPNYPTPTYYTPATASNSTVAYSTLGVNGKGNYPDWFDQCQQAIQAGQYANTNSTIVFSVAYGAGTSTNSGCVGGWGIGVTDTTLLGSVKSAATVSYELSSLTPCVEMENIATSLTTFYSDYEQGGASSGCNDASHATVALSEIFESIATTFTTPRLIPNNAT